MNMKIILLLALWVPYSVFAQNTSCDSIVKLNEYLSKVSAAEASSTDVYSAYRHGFTAAASGFLESANKKLEQERKAQSGVDESKKGAQGLEGMRKIVENKSLQKPIRGSKEEAKLALDLACAQCKGQAINYYQLHAEMVKACDGTDAKAGAALTTFNNDSSKLALAKPFNKDSVLTAQPPVIATTTTLAVTLPTATTTTTTTTTLAAKKSLGDPAGMSCGEELQLAAKIIGINPEWRAKFIQLDCTSQGGFSLADVVGENAEMKAMTVNCGWGVKTYTGNPGRRECKGLKANPAPAAKKNDLEAGRCKLRNDLLDANTEPAMEGDKTICMIAPIKNVYSFVPCDLMKKEVRKGKYCEWVDESLPTLIYRRPIQ